MARRPSSVRLSVCPSVNFCENRFFSQKMAGSPPNFHKMDSRSACIQGVLKVKVKVKGHVIRALSWILGMSYSLIFAVLFMSPLRRHISVCFMAKSAFFLGGGGVSALAP